MSDDTQKRTLLEAISLISSAERLVTQAIRRTDDAAIRLRLNAEYARLDSLLSLMLHAQAFSEHADFSNVITVLQQRVTRMQAQATDMKANMPDLVLASTIDSYISQAISLIASL